LAIEMPEAPPPISTAAESPPALDLLVAGDGVPDAIVGDVAGEIAFGQAETLVERGALTVGGSSAIMACGAARLGLRVAFVGVFGNDAAGRFMLEELSARGVDTSACMVLPDRSTGLTVHVVRPGAERDRAMLTSPGCVGELTASMVERALVGSVRHLHVGSFFLLPKLAHDLAAVFTSAREAGCTTSLDTQGDSQGRWQGGLREALRESDLFFPNRSEACAVAESLGAGEVVGDDLGRTLEMLAALGPRPVVKCGAQGAATLDGQAVVWAPALSITPVDTIGAGDSFDAGYVHSFLKGWPVERCLALAAACGSLSTGATGGVGAQPQIAEALAALKDAAPDVARPSG
jgi:sugar/nucleoside kinase (ribokinase family)